MIEKYKNNIAWLYKRKDNTSQEDRTPKWEEEGTPFFCNREMIKRRLSSMGANQFMYEAIEIIKTSSQLPFAQGDRITFIKNPRDDVDYQDFSLIEEIEPKPIQERGNKYRTRELYEYWIRLT